MLDVIRKYYRSIILDENEEAPSMPSIPSMPDWQDTVDMDIDDPERLILSETVLASYIRIERERSSGSGLDDRAQSKVDECLNKKYKASIVFHGGCLICDITKIIGISECYSCYYYNWVTDNPVFRLDKDYFPYKGSPEYISDNVKDKYPEYFI